MTVLVTGAAGFIGSAVSRRLLEAGQDVVGVDVLNEAYDVRLKEHRLEALRGHEGFTFHRTDIRDADGMDTLMEGVETVYHLAARAGVRDSLEDPREYADVNVCGTIQVLESCRRHDVPRMVMASTSSVYGNGPDRAFREDDDTSHPLSPYAASKKAAELQCAAYNHLYGIHTPVLRFFTVYGPAGRPDMSIYRFIEWMRRGEPIQVYGDGHQRRDFTYVDDIARGFLAASRVKGHDAINLGGGNPASLREVIGHLEELMGIEAKVEYGEAAPADVRGTWADITKARRLFEWEPRIGLRSGLEAGVGWHLRQVTSHPTV